MNAGEITQAIVRAHAAIGDATPPRPEHSNEPVSETDLWQQFAAHLGPVGLDVRQDTDTHNVANVCNQGKLVARLCYVPERFAVVFELVEPGR